LNRGKIKGAGPEQGELFMDGKLNQEYFSQFVLTMNRIGDYLDEILKDLKRTDSLLHNLLYVEPEEKRIKLCEGYQQCVLVRYNLMMQRKNIVKDIAIYFNNGIHSVYLTSDFCRIYCLKKNPFDLNLEWDVTDLLLDFSA
jgi:hypothetical protein